MAKLIFGCGYLGLRVARLWQSAGQEVFAVTRSTQRATELAAQGVRPLVADLASAEQMQVPGDVQTVLWAVGYDRKSGGRGENPATRQPGPPSLHDVYVAGLARAIGRLPPSASRLLYISSTGVYGQVTGSEVDEDSLCQPTREGGRACLAAESLLQASPLADRTIVLRLAGIYGPGRIPRSRDLLAGTPIDAPAAGWLNLIHVDDAARIVLLAEERAQPPRRYVVSDGQPVVRGDYYRELARLLGAPPPRFIEPEAGSPAQARAASDKRVNPRRMLADLAPTLLFPSYREGLAAIVASE